MEVDPSVFEAIKKICDKQPQELTKEDIGFLRARISYLNGEQLSRFEKLLSEPEAKTVK